MKKVTFVCTDNVKLTMTHVPDEAVDALFASAQSNSIAQWVIGEGNTRGDKSLIRVDHIIAITSESSDE